MMILINKQRGLTLLEFVLVFVIGTSMALMGLRVYYSFKADNDVRLIQNTVDQLFQSMSFFYQANCRNPYDVNGIPIVNGSTGLLDPSHNPVPANPYNIPISVGAASLLKNGFLMTAWPPPVSTMIDRTYADYGFSVQFNQITSVLSHTPGNIDNDWVVPPPPPPPPPPPNNFSFTTPVGVIYTWRSQVVLKLAATIDSKKYTDYQKRLGATCTVTSPTATCAAAASGPYLVWERLPGHASKTSSVLNFSMPRIKSFTNSYYNDDMYTATNPYDATNNPTGIKNYYLCGG